MSREMVFGNIKVYVEGDYEGMSRKAADLFCEEVRRNPQGKYGLATGSTPVGMYQELIKRYEAGQVDFGQVVTFNLDEYYPIKKANDQSYDYFMKENLFNHINAEAGNINIPNGEAKDPEVECAEYEEKIRERGGVDLQILGIGENGHIGFNEPAEYFAKETNYIALTESTISANARFFESADEVPKHALTMGIKTIMQAKRIMLMASSAKKAEILAQALLGEITPKVPASVLQLHRDVVIVVDEEAASRLEK